MLYITQLIYVVKGKEDIFHEFENMTIPLVEKYKGNLLLRVRPRKEDIIEMNKIEAPYEIHVLTFDSENDFENFLQNDVRKQFLYLKEQSIKAVLLIKGGLL